MIFSITSNQENKENLNNTNIIDTNNIIFTDDYIEKNFELISAFIKLIIVKNNINSCIIKDFEIATTVIDLIKNISEFDKLSFAPNKTIPHEVYEKLNEHCYIEEIECYNMAQYMFEDLNRKGYHVTLKSKVFFVSKFMYHDNLKTYSDLYYKKVLTINFKLDDVDLKEFEAFLKINNCLKVIEFKLYDKKSLENVLKILALYRKRNIKIYIYEKDKNIIPDIDYLHHLQKKYKDLRFKIIYSEKYKKENRIKQINLNILKAILLIVIITILGFFLINRKEEDQSKKVKEEVKKVKEEIITDETEEPKAEVQEEKKTPYVETAYNKKYSKVFSELKAINDETVGWLKVNGTNIDYPVVKHSDNSFYLSHDFNKNNNRYGWLFADYQSRITPLNQNTIIYGHDSGRVMFSGLYQTKNKRWYTNKNNQIITFNTENEEGQWQIFSIYSIDNTTDYLIIEFGTEKAFTDYINMVKGRSIYNFNVNVGPNDKILTLSTCFGNTQKLVVHAKKIN